MRTEQFYGLMRHMLMHEFVAARPYKDGWWEDFRKRADEQMDRVCFRVPTDKEWISVLIGYPNMVPIWKKLMAEEQ